MRHHIFLLSAVALLFYCDSLFAQKQATIAQLQHLFAGKLNATTHLVESAHPKAHNLLTAQGFEILKKVSATTFIVKRSSPTKKMA